MTPSSGSHAPVRTRRPDHSSLLTSSRTAGSKSLRLVLAMAMVAMMSLVGQATLPRELQSSAQAAGPVTSSLSLFTLTSTVSPTTLPAGGGNLTVTYTVKNISSDTIWYSRDNNSLCVTSQTGMTASTYYRGDYYMRPGQTATFTCTGYVSQTKDIKATFDFVTPRGTRSTATVTDKVTIGTVINNLPGCDTPLVLELHGRDGLVHRNGQPDDQDDGTDVHHQALHLVRLRQWHVLHVHDRRGLIRYGDRPHQPPVCLLLGAQPSRGATEASSPTSSSGST